MILSDYDSFTASSSMLNNDEIGSTDWGSFYIAFYLCLIVFKENRLCSISNSEGLNSVTEFILSIRANEC